MKGKAIKKEKSTGNKYSNAFWKHFTDTIKKIILKNMAKGDINTVDDIINENSHRIEFYLECYEHDKEAYYKKMMISLISENILQTSIRKINKKKILDLLAGERYFQ